MLSALFLVRAYKSYELSTLGSHINHSKQLSLRNSHHLPVLSKPQQYDAIFHIPGQRPFPGSASPRPANLAAKTRALQSTYRNGSMAHYQHRCGQRPTECSYRLCHPLPRHRHQPWSGVRHVLRGLHARRHGLQTRRGPRLASLR